MNKLIKESNLFFIRTNKQALDYYNTFIKGRNIILPDKININLNNITNNIFVINLLKDTDKKENINKKFQRYGIENYTFFEGIIPDEKYQEIFEIVSNYNDKWGRINYIGEMGCFLSHKKIWENIVSENLDNSLILEDDIYFHKNFQKILEDNISVFDKYDIIYFGCNQSQFSKAIINNIILNNQQKLNIYDNLSKLEYLEVISYGTFAYYIKNNVAKIFVEEFESGEFIWRTIDVFMQKTIKKYNLKSCIFFPNLIISDVSSSSIREGRDMIEFAKLKKWDLPFYDFT